MQRTVDTVHDSDHTTSKVAATLATQQGEIISKVNDWPSVIKNAIGTQQRIGNASGTVHAETLCILGSITPTENASLYITDPPCPNCMKNMTEAGIKNLYIDHKGFSKDFAQRRGHYFETMSMQIAGKAGMNVYEVKRKEQKCSAIIEAIPSYHPLYENPPVIEEINDRFETDDFFNFIKTQEKYYTSTFGIVIASNKENRIILSAQPHASTGYATKNLEKSASKYSYILQPINRLMMIAARRGYKIENGFVFSSQVPTSRELVNMVGAELNNIYIGDTKKSRDPESINALQSLLKNNIMILKA